MRSRLAREGRPHQTRARTHQITPARFLICGLTLFVRSPSPRRRDPNFIPLELCAFLPGQKATGVNDPADVDRMVKALSTPPSHRYDKIQDVVTEMGTDALGDLNLQIDPKSIVLNGRMQHLPQV